jgi:putative ABC transport system permease protein
MFRLLDSILLALERLWQHKALVLWALVGLCVATTLALSLSLYVDAVNTGLLTSHLTDPPYAVRFRYLGSWEGNITQADVTAASAAIGSGFSNTVGLPVAHAVTYVSSGAWTVRTNTNINLGALKFASLEGADEQVEITAGAWPPEADAGGEIPVLLPQAMLYTMGVQVGDILMAQRSGAEPVTLRVAALWRAEHETDPQWIFTPKYFDAVIFMQPDDLRNTFEGIDLPIEEAAWFLIFDGSSVKTADVGRLIGSIGEGERSVTAALPGIRLDLSPVTGLNAFSQEVNALTQQLILMILPVGGLVLYFVSLIAGLLVTRQQQEDVTLRSRGMSRRAIVGLHWLMWLILTGTAFAVAIAVSPTLVQLVGQTTSFLRFDGVGESLTIVFTPQALAIAAATGLIAASSALLLAWRTSNQTITSFKRAAARASKAWWQRLYLDVLLLIPATYVLYTLWQRGGIRTQADNPFSDPLTFLGPTIFSLGLVLLFLRLWPTLMRFVSGIVTYSNSIALLMALRELTRSIGRYRGTLLMMGFTLSLMGFTASMASTLDRSLADSVSYRIGADAVIVTAVDALTEQGEATDEGQQTLTVTGFNILPPDDLLTIPGVEQVSRVGRFPARLVLPGQRLEGTALGVDRATIAAVTRSRADYAPEPYADLFNRLAGNRSGIVVSLKTASDYNLRIGQEVELQISALSEWYSTDVPIIGFTQYFPTLNPDSGFFAITNLDPLFELVGTPLPHDYWLSLSPDADHVQVQARARQLGFPVIEWRDPEAALLAAMASPSRRGVLGFLSVGFIASVLLTLVSAIVQSTAAFRAQAAQLGSLRAMGLGGLSVAVYLILLQGMAAASGILSGTSIGVATTLLFLPLLDFSDGLPPYLVRVAWSDILLVYAIFATILFFVTLLTTLLMSRERLTTIVKLGDA